MHKRILLTGFLRREVYADAINRSGGSGTAIYPPECDLPFESLLDYDGLVLCGGNDIDPAYFGQAINGAVKIDKPRDEAEWKLAEAYVEMKKPILGICRGHQLLNVFFGGTLIQDLPNKAHHTSGKDYSTVHGATAAAGSIMAELYGQQEIPVNSYHHQALDKIGRGFRVTMLSDDGVVEAMEHETLPIFSVQWHPEQMCYTKSRPDTVDGAPIFRKFLELCEK